MAGTACVAGEVVLTTAPWACAGSCFGTAAVAVHCEVGVAVGNTGTSAEADGGVTACNTVGWAWVPVLIGAAWEHTGWSTSWRSNWRKPKPFADIFFSNVHQRSTMSVRARSECARRREFPRRGNFRDSNDVEFTKDIAKSFADQCRSRLTVKISNATLFKHFARRKWRLFTFTQRVSRRTIPNDSSRLFRTDLPLRSCFYDASNSRYRCSKFRRCNTSWRFNSMTTSSEWERCA